MWNHYDDYRPYVPVADRRAAAEKKMRALRRQGYEITPIEAFRGNKIAQSFWGHAWCRHLESFSDYESRLPRGRTYVRNGSVCHLAISSGKIEAMVYGSELYEIAIHIAPLSAEKWSALKKQCSGKIGTLLELLQGKLSDEIMKIVTDRSDGLFPSPKEIRLDCNCPDYADLCKHLAAVLYGVGVRLDDQPELLFLLRGVNHQELVEADLSSALAPKFGASSRRRLAPSALSNVFGVDIAADADEPPARPSSSPEPSSPSLPATTVAPGGKPAKKAAAPKKPSAKKRPAKPKKKRAQKRARKAAPQTGADVLKLRRRFGMTEWEFGLIAEVSSTTVRNWEAKGKGPHRARAQNQEILDAVAQLSKSAAWDRLDDYL